jgi:hypothetical protein
MRCPEILLAAEGGYAITFDLNYIAPSTICLPPLKILLSSVASRSWSFKVQFICTLRICHDHVHDGLCSAQSTRAEQNQASYTFRFLTRRYDADRVGLHCGGLRARWSALLKRFLICLFLTLTRQICVRSSLRSPLQLHIVYRLLQSPLLSSCLCHSVLRRWTHLRSQERL